MNQGSQLKTNKLVIVHHKLILSALRVSFRSPLRPTLHRRPQMLPPLQWPRRSKVSPPGTQRPPLTPPPWPCCVSYRRPSTGRAQPPSPTLKPGSSSSSSSSNSVLTMSCQQHQPPVYHHSSCTRPWTGSTSTRAERTASTVTTATGSTAPSRTGIGMTACCRPCWT